LLCAVLKVPVPFFFEGLPDVPEADGETAALDSFFATSEGVAMAVAFGRIRNANVRGAIVALRHLRGPVSLTGGQSQASIFNDLGGWLQCAMEGEMVNQPTAKDRLIDRRGVLRTGAALAPLFAGWGRIDLSILVVP
jgi:hypothetical protein